MHNGPDISDIRSAPINSPVPIYLLDTKLESFFLLYDIYRADISVQLSNAINKTQFRFNVAKLLHSQSRQSIKLSKDQNILNISSPMTQSAYKSVRFKFTSF